MSRLRHVALFVPTLEGGGAERNMVNLANALAEELPRCDLVVAKAEGPYRAEVAARARVFDLQRRVAASALPLSWYLARERPDVLLATLTHANVTAILASYLAGRRTRVFLREANTLSRNIPRDAPWRARMLPALVRRTYPLAAGLVAPSIGVANDLQRFVPGSTIDVIENPVLVPSVQELANEALAHPFFDSDEPVVLGVGRLEPQKDFMTLIRAFAQLRAETGSGRLVILGEGSRRQELMAEADRLQVTEHIALPGFVRNPFAFMARASLFVLSSTHEGLPNVLIQALALGCPAVSTDCESGPREILMGGRVGELVDVGDVGAMAKAMARTLESPPPRGERLDAVARFDARRVAVRYADVFSRMG